MERAALLTVTSTINHVLKCAISEYLHQWRLIYPIIVTTIAGEFTQLC